MPIAVPEEKFDGYTIPEMVERILEVKAELRQYYTKVCSQRDEIGVLKDMVKRYERMIDILMEKV